MDSVDSSVSDSTDGGEKNVESCVPGESACMPLYEELDAAKTNSEWRNRKSLSNEKYKGELINQVIDSAYCSAHTAFIPHKL